jgi:hypothetical protein
MAQQALDGVVEAVRFDAEGLVSLARVYERRGPIFSDRVLLTRPELIARLKTKKRFFTGRRIISMGGVFTTVYPIHLAQVQDGEILTTGLTRAVDFSDNLEGVPLF